MRFSLCSGIATAIALSSVLAGCGASAPSLPSSQGGGNAPGLQARANAASLSGIYVAWVPEFDHHLGPVKLMLQVGAPGSGCDTYAVLVPAPPAKGAASPFAAPYYKTEIALKRYAPGQGFVSIVGRGTFGKDLGALSVKGELRAERFHLRYADKRGGGVITAHYIGACKPPQLGDPQTPPSSAFLGNWTISLGAATYGNFPQPASTMQLTINSASAPGATGQILLTGTVGTANNFVPGGPPYNVRATWTNGTWYLPIARVIGTFKGTMIMSTTSWYPPNSDATNGTWYATTTPNDGAPDLLQNAGGTSVSIAPSP